MYVKCKMMIRKYELDHSFQINKAITLLPPLIDISRFPLSKLNFSINSKLMLTKDKSLFYDLYT